MKIKKSKIEGVFLIRPELFKDKRGTFRRHFCKKTLKKNNINFNTVQGNISENFKRGTLRGFHYTKEPTKEAKILSCITGSIYNVVIDLRKNSNTFKKYFFIELSSQNLFSLVIPPMCANAFLTLKKNTLLHYYMGDYFNPNKYSGFRYNDPLFNIKWPLKPKIISKKDSSYPNLKLK